MSSFAQMKSMGYRMLFLLTKSQSLEVMMMNTLFTRKQKVISLRVYFSCNPLPNMAIKKNKQAQHTKGRA